MAMASMRRGGVRAAQNSMTTSTRRAFLATDAAPLKRTALHADHVALGGRMVPFCGWDMPVQYKESIIDTHTHTRTHAGLFDVSHMGQLKLHGRDRVEFMESLVVGDIKGLATDNARLSLFTNEQGGIKDDTVITNGADWLYVVVNAGCADKDLAHIQEHLARFKASGKEVDLEILSPDYSLVALQGPEAAAVVGEHIAGGPESLRGLAFMSGRDTRFDSLPVRITRCGYTGEDGFEISVPTSDAVTLWRTLLQHTGKVMPVGLAARDSLRLEAGLCLYGNDITEETTPIEAGLAWTIGKRRRAEGGFPGADVILKQIKEGVTRKRVGFVLGEGIARAHATVHDEKGELLGEATSGGYGPSLKKAVGMTYLPTALAKNGTPIQVQVRKKFYPATVAAMPFHPTNYYKPTQ